MKPSPSQWSVNDYSASMLNAVQGHADSRVFKRVGDKLLFNGFWRNGDKQNVCLWLDKASWHDAKTGEGGGCKEFAKVAFNMSLPDFMDRFGQTQYFAKPINITKSFQAPINNSLPKIWQAIKLKDKNRHDHATDWLENVRGFKGAKKFIGSGFANIYQEDLLLFSKEHKKFMQDRLNISKQIVVPLRGVHSDEVKNLFIRSIKECPKDEKTRLLRGMGGWHETDNSPRAFGFPHLIHEFPNLILCEGMADYFACEILLDCEHNYLPLGVATASAFPKWAEWLALNNYKGKVLVIFHLDEDKHGNLSDKGIGQDNSIKSVQILRKSSIPSNIFDWLKFLDELRKKTDKHVMSNTRDLADIFYLNIELEIIQQAFHEGLA